MAHAAVTAPSIHRPTCACPQEVPWGFAYSYPVALSGELGDVLHTHRHRGSHPGQRPVVVERLERHTAVMYGITAVLVARALAGQKQPESAAVPQPMNAFPHSHSCPTLTNLDVFDPDLVRT